MLMNIKHLAKKKKKKGKMPWEFKLPKTKKIKNRYKLELSALSGNSSE